MYFKTNFFLKRGINILIRTDYYSPPAFCMCDFESFPTPIFEKIKWCKEIPNAISPYEVGVKYYVPLIRSSRMYKDKPAATKFVCEECSQVAMEEAISANPQPSVD